MINKVLIAGAGLVGSEIGFQCAVHGLDVVMFDVAPQSLTASRESHVKYAGLFRSKGLLSSMSERGTFGTMKRHPGPACT
jgi:3-hydroxybutyryl-CoA dehydrogenase